MFEQLKALLTDEYQSELDQFLKLKNQIEELEVKMQEDTSETDYQKNLKELNSKYNLLKRHKKEYKNELYNLKNTYYEELKKFQENYEKYIDLKREASSINIYIIQKKLDQLKVAKNLEDLKMTEEEATKIIEERLTS